MLYTEKEKNEIERIREVFEKHIREMTLMIWFGQTKLAMFGWLFLLT